MFFTAIHHLLSAILASFFLPTVPADVDGYSHVVFDSNRSGSFGIYISDLNKNKVQPLYDTKEHEMYPSPSPDGSKIVFAKTSSLDRDAYSEIWIINSKGGTAELLVKDATFPTFSPDGKFVYFERRRSKALKINLETKKVEEVFPKNFAAFKGHKIIKPKVSPDGRKIAFSSDKKGKWNAWIADLETGKATHINHGCEPTWLNSNQKLAWINRKDAFGGSGIFEFDLEGGKKSSLHDPEMELGHEYFPNMSSDGKYLIYSACSNKQHSHIKANYQVFIKDLKANKLRQITSDSHTNRWPSLLRIP